MRKRDGSALKELVERAVKPQDVKGVIKAIRNAGKDMGGDGKKVNVAAFTVRFAPDVRRPQWVSEEGLMELARNLPAQRMSTLFQVAREVDGKLQVQYVHYDGTGEPHVKTIKACPGYGPEDAFERWQDTFPRGLVSIWDFERKVPLTVQFTPATPQ
jgi:hypothetical protein